MRPHVELIHNDDLIWHAAELPRGEGKTAQRNLSYDEESGAASTKVSFHSNWSRPEGYHHADTEWFVVDGEVKVGDRVLGRYGYFRAPAGLKVPPIEVREGTELLLYREYGDFGFSSSAKDRDDFIRPGGNTVSSDRGELTLVNAHTDLKWSPNIYEGDSQRFLHLKLLYRDPSPEDDHTKGFVTLMAFAPPGWREHRLAHHPCFEEAYCLYGGMNYNFGDITPGTYFFRPARVKHGNFDAKEEKGAVWIFRLDGDLINWITVDAKFEVSGIAKNYDPGDPTQAPVIAGLPVRSRTTGPWDGQGR